jgi:hypothetical protein
MATAWITYAWRDNQEGDLDFIVQELIRAGLAIKLDRWNIQAGRRLWEQIEKFITDPSQCDGWIMYATQNSLASEACREELAYALDRALSTRGGTFPIIALLPSHAEEGFLPAAIRTRLYVDLSDPDWKDRIVGAVANRQHVRSTAEMTPYFVKIHPAPSGFQLLLEVRPRAGVWYPFATCVDVREKDVVALVLRGGPRGFIPPIEGLNIAGGTGLSGDGQWYIETGYQAATPTHSYYLFYKKIPSRLAFGQLDTPGQMFFWTPNA